MNNRAIEVLQSDIGALRSKGFQVEKKVVPLTLLDAKHDLPLGAHRQEKIRRQRKRIRKLRRAGLPVQNTTGTSVSHAIIPVAIPAKVRARHLGVLLSFLLLVAAPAALTFWYLTEIAADQYASNVGFTVRKENAGSGLEILGGLTQIGSNETSDSDILYEFIQSQNLVQLVDARLDLRTLYSKPKNDPVFTISPDAPIEKLHDYWGRMVKISYGGNGLIQLRVLAFSADDAQQVAQVIFDESLAVVNRLNAIARQDATRYAQVELDQSLESLIAARQGLTLFRNDTQIVDPNADIQGQMSLLNTLNQRLAGALIELDLLSDGARVNDPRGDQVSRKITVIQARIKDERKKLGVGAGVDGKAYANLVGEYESLIVEREFAEKTYLTALTALNNSKAEAQRQGRYLASFIGPTLAQSSQYPERWVLLGLITLFAFVIWSILVLVAYSIKDRR